MVQKHLVTKLLFGIALIAVLLTACKKFYSYENGVIALMIAKGTLQDSAGNCQNIVINGNYMQGAALTTDNYITVQANITTAGKYSILTDTVNGCWFMDTGIVMSTGPQIFKIKGYGKPVLPVFDVFSVRFAGTVCQFTIPANKAVYTFDAPAGTCPNILVNGSYMVGAALNATDSVTMPVHVTTAGTYNIQTPAVNGIVFAANGVFLNTGYYNVKLLGNGVPYIAETVSFPVNVGAVGCSFAVATKVDTSMIWQFTANGITYKGYVQDSLRPFNGNDPANPKNQFYGLQVQGRDYTSGNGSLKGINFTIRRINNPWLPGIYHSIDAEKDFSCVFYYSKYDSLNSAGSSLFIADILQPSFAINLQVIDTNSRLVQGTFSGPVYKKNNQNDPPDTVVNITNGYFKTYLAH